MSGTDVRVRFLKLAERLFTGGDISIAYVRDHFPVSLATAKRDLIVLEATLPLIAVREPSAGGWRKILRMRPDGPRFTPLRCDGL
jgi:hypothetical protein